MAQLEVELQLWVVSLPYSWGHKTLVISPGSRLTGSRLGWALEDCLGLTYVYLALERAVKVNLD